MLHDVSLQDFILKSPNDIDIEDKTDFMYMRFIIMLYKNATFTQVF
jgi:hypothetical protein